MAKIVKGAAMGLINMSVRKLLDLKVEAFPRISNLEEIEKIVHFVWIILNQKHEYLEQYSLLFTARERLPGQHQLTLQALKTQERIMIQGWGPLSNNDVKALDEADEIIYALYPKSGEDRGTLLSCVACTSECIRSKNDKNDIWKFRLLSEHIRLAEELSLLKQQLAKYFPEA
jgi:hypothetical protein